ncbi:PAP2 superfamily protein [Antricoccus suffuscus]|uniref:PAP2 superfamily protein n=1 Tax=Antricoccus suffuscus TaxID=1629062 RepID=A0A2T1A370_9ACTN|nr:phosphatase PAP2 family protein [Antricoccus suffuscus]PRZ43050.1 PAP2 superfamily protein [Antricoccus suffuscus]
MSAGGQWDQRNRHSGLNSRGWHRPVAELAVLTVCLVLFSRLHNLAGSDVAQANANARALQSVERTLNLDIEVAANHWLAEHAVLMQAAVLYYRRYYVPLAVVLLWVLFRHAETYLTVRRTLLVMMPLALVAFWLVPMSPPRFGLDGIIDIVAEHDLVLGDTSRDMTNGQNHFSAMPSMHVGWSALGAYAAWLALRSRRPRLALLVWLFPIVMIAVVLTTGNHYVLDVAGSVVLLSVSIATAAVWTVTVARWRLHRSKRSIE